MALQGYFLESYSPILGNIFGKLDGTTMGKAVIFARMLFWPALKDMVVVISYENISSQWNIQPHKLYLLNPEIMNFLLMSDILGWQNNFSPKIT